LFNLQYVAIQLQVCCKSDHLSQSLWLAVLEKVMLFIKVSSVNDAIHPSSEFFKIDHDSPLFSQLWRSTTLEILCVPIPQIRKKDHPQLALKSFRFFDLGLAQLLPVHGHLSDLLFPRFE